MAVLVQEALVDHKVGATTGSTDGRLGRTFMARNGLIMATRRPMLGKLAWLLYWAWQYIVRPLLLGRLDQLRDYVIGALNVGADPAELKERL